MKILVDIISEIKSSIGINRSAVMLPVIPTNPKKKKKGMRESAELTRLSQRREKGTITP